MLDKRREMEYTKKLKENELVVYTATPEQINKMLKGGSNMGRPVGSKNKTTNLQMAKEKAEKKSQQKKSEKVQAIVDIIMEEAKADKEATGAVTNTEEIRSDAIKAIPGLFPEVNPELIKGAVEAVSPKLPIIEPKVAPAKVESDFRGKLLSSIKKAALTACIEEIADYVTGINPENMNEKLKGIRGTVNVVLEELEFHEI